MDASESEDGSRLALRWALSYLRHEGFSEMECVKGVSGGIPAISARLGTTRVTVAIRLVASIDDAPSRGITTDEGDRLLRAYGADADRIDVLEVALDEKGLAHIRHLVGIRYPKRDDS